MSGLTLLVLSLFGALPAQDGELAPARALYLANCAACHGESGDGRGTQVLERPARSFRDGGFSYGNTLEALARTITHGIPGTAMPSFTPALDEAQRLALARYVLTLGPETVAVDAAATELVVRDTPLFVRGKLPALAPGLADTVRGLLVGTASGLSFEYRVDDVRLLAVRQGAFVGRRDWNGRGGDALQPLGKLVHLCALGAPGPAFQWKHEREEPLTARFLGTAVRAGAPRLELRLETASGPVALATESVSSRALAGAAGFARRLEFQSLRAERPGRLVVEPWSRGGGRLLVRGERWVALLGADGLVELHALRAEGDVAARLDDAARLHVDPRGAVELLTCTGQRWSDELRAALAQDQRP